MKVKEMTGLIGGDKGSRRKNDFYPTPKYVTDMLLDRITFEGKIWEPACGDGAISKELIARGYDVKSTDLNDYDYGTPGLDFLKSLEQYDNIVTNPPFNLSTKFALHGLNLVRKKLVLFNKLTFLEGKIRRNKLFNQNKLEKVIVFSERLNFAFPDEKGGKGGMLAFAWFVFDKNYNGEARIEWI